MKSPIRFSLLLLLATLSACQEDEPKAPPITTENTFSCKINGELFIPQDHSQGIGVGKGIKPDAIPNHSWIFILANKKRDIYVYVYNVTTTGEYTITASDGDHDFLFETENLSEMRVGDLPGVAYVSTNNNEVVEVLELVLDTKIILQFEEITLVNDTNPADVVKLTDGKLNINLETFGQ